ncbi:MAG: hypothetical protein J5527_13760 [Treponema sp.]|nr:hypothetical protein [Treponema sp.]
MQYDFQDDMEGAFKDYVDSWKELKKSYKIWQIAKLANVKNSKKMYGAEQALAREKMRISFRLPWFLKSNIEVPVLYFKKATLILFPDKILVVNKIKAGAINQEQVTLKIYEDAFIEHEIKPKDAEFIKYQWEHPNKDGDPDKRFQNNRQLPIYKYAFIEINSPEGINEMIMSTNNKICNRLSESYNAYRNSVTY